MSAALGLLLIMAVAYLAFAVWFERRTRPENIADAHSTSEAGLWR